MRVLGVALVLSAFLVSVAAPAVQAPDSESGLLDATTIPKYVNELTGPPPVWEPTLVKKGGRVVAHEYEIEMTAFAQQMLPEGFPMTPVWGYGGMARDALTGEPLGYVRSSPGASFEALSGVPVSVRWRNNVVTPHMFPVDPTLHWADPNGFGMPMAPFTPYPPGYPEAQAPVPLVTHLHGAEVRSTSDGGPDAWFTATGTHGDGYSTEKKAKGNEAVFQYPNAQPATTLWYHDHALGITRINVMSGLAGFYLLRDPADPIAPLLPAGKYEMPIVIQDRTFNADGTMWFPTVGLNPDDHPYWMPEFFGDAIMVNGKVWPNLNVDQGQYRFRLLDGSNARFYTLSFRVPATGQRLPFVQIGSDGGYLRSPAPLTELTFAPGERADVLVDFSGLAAGTKVILDNKAKAPFPHGTPADPQTVGQIMQFTVSGEPGPAPAVLPPILNPVLAAFPSLPSATKTRTLVLVEVMGPGGPLEILLNGQKWHAPVSEVPTLGTTEEWVVVNPTADTHPIHLHLAQFQLVSRQKVQAAQYNGDWMMMNGGMPPYYMTPMELPVGPYLVGGPAPAPPQEQGWKDTIKMHPGEVTVIRVRFAPIDGTPSYPFDATVGPGYVWHCHILDHEDNEMMRPYVVARA